MTVPLTVVIDERPHKVQDWSFGGFRIVDFGDEMRAGEELTGQLVLPYRASTLRIDIRFRVVWRAKIDVGCQFIELPRTAQLALQHLLQDAMEGRLYEIETAPEVTAEAGPTPSGEAVWDEGSDLPEGDRGESPYAVERPAGDRPRALRTSHPYLAAAAVVLAVALLLLSRNLDFAGAATDDEDRRPVTESSALPPVRQSLPPREADTPAMEEGEPVTVESVVPAAPSSGVAVQLGAFGSEDGAWSFADELATRSPALPEGADYHLRPLNPSDPDSLIRLLIEPLETPAVAEALCARFGAAGNDCIVRSAAWLEAQP